MTQKMAGEAQTLDELLNIITFLVGTGLSQRPMKLK